MLLNDKYKLSLQPVIMRHLLNVAIIAPLLCIVMYVSMTGCRIKLQSTCGKQFYVGALSIVPTRQKVFSK